MVIEEEEERELSSATNMDERKDLFHNAIIVQCLCLHKL